MGIAANKSVAKSPLFQTIIDGFKEAKDAAAKGYVKNANNIAKYGDDLLKPEEQKEFFNILNRAKSKNATPKQKEQLQEVLEYFPSFADLNKADFDEAGHFTEKTLNDFKNLKNNAEEMIATYGPNGENIDINNLGLLDMPGFGLSILDNYYRPNGKLMNSRALATVGGLEGTLLATRVLSGGDLTHDSQGNRNIVGLPI